MSRQLLATLSIDFLDDDTGERLATWSIDDGVIPRIGETVVLYEDNPKTYVVAGVVHEEAAVTVELAAP